MRKQDEGKPKIQSIGHICMVVDDIDRYIKIYEEEYGIGPWYWGGEDEFRYLAGSTHVHGKQVDFKARLALCDALNVKLELIQPLDEYSHYAEFLREHGCGIHHLFARVEDNDKFEKEVTERGNEVLFKGDITAPPYKERGEKQQCTYFDMRDDLGFICEIAGDWHK